MKKSLIIIVAMAGCAMTGLAATGHEYLPLVEEGKTWHYKIPYDTVGTAMCNEGATECSLTMRGDTVIDGLAYKKIFFADRKAPNMPWPVAYMREENKVVTTKGNSEAVTWLRNTSNTCHNYTEFLYADNVKYDFNDYSSPDLSNSDFQIPGTPIMTMTEDNRGAIARTAAYWWSNVSDVANRDCTEIWVTEGIGADGADVQLLRMDNKVRMWYGATTILGYLQYVTDADGAVIYRGRFAVSEPTAVRDIAASTIVASEEYYGVNGVKLGAPQRGVAIRVVRYTDGTVRTTKEIW